MEIVITDASIRMIDELYELEQQCFQEEAFSKQQISYLLTDYNAVSLAAKINDRIAGFIIGRIDIIRNQPVGHIMTIDVALLFRRKGVGQRLMQETEALFRQKGVKEIRLEAREGNTTAIGLYEKLGYKRISKLEHYYGEAHGFYFRKILQ
jgi:[ribosomal protein S18]-alanine N-acetyltransferase